MQCNAALREILTRQFCELAAFERDEAEYDDDDGADEVERFFGAITECVQPKRAKYAKAVARILDGVQATMFLAIEYRDAESLRASEPFNGCFPRSLSQDAPDDARRLRTWQTLRVLARLCFAIKGIEPPAVPSPGEIEANIHRFREAKQRAKHAATAVGGTGSMQRAFFEKLLETASLMTSEAAGAFRARMHAIPTQEHAAVCAMWAANPFVKRSVPFGGGAFAADELRGFESLDAARWAVAEGFFRQLNDLSKVQQNIPAGMLGTIENYANSLAGKITSGDADFSSLDLQSIGEDVLKQCSEEDMSQLANNIGSLLPALGSLQQTVQSQAAEAGQPMPQLNPLAGLSALGAPPT